MRKFITVIFQFLKYLWVAPNTLLGLLCAIGSKVHLVNGVIEIHGPITRIVLNHTGLCRGAAAMTLGHVVIGQDPYRGNYFEVEAYSRDV